MKISTNRVALAAACGLAASLSSLAIAKPVETITFAPLNMQAILAEDMIAAQNDDVQRFAMPQLDNVYSPHASGTIEFLDNGRIAWRLRYTCENAAHFNVGADYLLPKGAFIELRDGEGNKSYRKFTYLDNNESGEFWFPVHRGNMLEIYAEVDAADWELFADNFMITSVNIGYRGFGAGVNFGGVEQSEACNVDVACPQGDPWELQISSVGVYTLQGFWTCSGSMINNTAQDGRPYFLTADHCGVTTGNDQTMVVYFNYENSFCRPPGSAASGGPGNGQLNQFLSGNHIRRATSGVTDFTLVELSTEPPQFWEIAYGGWNRSSAMAQNSFGVHHPNTDEKRICFDNQSTFLNGSNLLGVSWNLGITAPGSSGSPLYDQNGLIIGQLCCGGSFCSTPTAPDFYGRFSGSWNGNGSSSGQLRAWLDPINTNQVTLDPLPPGGVLGPANDLCENAEVIGLGNTLINTVNAETDGPTVGGTCASGGDNQIGSDVWYSYTPSSSGLVRFRTCGSLFDTKVAVYDTCPSPGAAPIACNDDFDCNNNGDLSDDTASLLYFMGIAGQEYLLRVGGYEGDTGVGGINVITMPAPSNDSCDSAMVVSAGTPVSADLFGSTPSGFGSTCGIASDAPDVWFEYTPEQSGLAVFAACDASFDASLAVYGSACPSGSSPLTCVDSGCGNNPLALLEVTGGQTYLVRLADESGLGDTATLTVSLTPSEPACDGDLDGDNDVDSDDLGTLLGAFGSSDAGDIDGDGDTDSDDLGMLLGAFGAALLTGRVV